jgi:hypothetical protein
MRFWHPLDILRAAFPAPVDDPRLQDLARRQAGKFAKRWQTAHRYEPALAADLIDLGGVLTLQPMTFDGGAVERATVDPAQLAYEAGRRDMALTLLAAMGVSTKELNYLLEVAADD